MCGTVIIILFSIYEMRFAVLFNKLVFGRGNLIYVKVLLVVIWSSISAQTNSLDRLNLCLYLVITCNKMFINL